jgi:hypothetical protein
MANGLTNSTGDRLPPLPLAGGQLKRFIMAEAAVRSPPHAAWILLRRVLCMICKPSVQELESNLLHEIAPFRFRALHEPSYTQRALG